MDTRKVLHPVNGLLPAILLCAAPAWAQAPAGYEAEETYPASTSLQLGYGEEFEDEQAESGARYARLAFFEGGLSLLRENEALSDDNHLAVNAPLVPGDEIWTGEDGRLELQLADGSILRLDRQSRLSLLNLADSEGTFDNTTLLRLPEGSLYVRTETFDPRDRRFQIDTPAGSIFLLSAGVFRVDVERGGVTTLASYRGVAEILSDDVSVIAHSGERLSLAPGRAPGEARAFNTLRRDDFDLWSEGRDDALASAGSGRGPRPEVPATVKPYVSELSRYGSWRLDPDYGWIWIPDNQASTWRPYYYGHWVHAPIGLNWVSYEPWGWAPYHYGRWHHLSGYGWFWAPGYIYSGAYVSWGIGPSFYGWCPTGYYGYPVVYRGYSPWVYIHHSTVFHKHVHRHAYSFDHARRHNFAAKRLDLRRHLRAHPRHHNDQFGSRLYNRALKDPGLVNRSRPGNGTPISFRAKELPRYRQLGNERSSRKAGGLRTGSNRSGKFGTKPGSGSGSGSRGGNGFNGQRSIQPISASPNSSRGGRTRPIISGTRSGKPAVISPVTGKPMRPPVRVTPSRQPNYRPDSGQTGRSRGSGVKPGTSTSPSDKGKIIHTYRGSPSSRSGSSRSVRDKDGSRVSPAKPHPRVEPRGSSQGQRKFVMKPRPSSRSAPKPAKSGSSSSKGSSKSSNKGKSSKKGNRH
jgi:hypothetical protein